MNDAYIHEDVDHFVLLTGSLDSDRQVLSVKDSTARSSRLNIPLRERADLTYYRWIIRWHFDRR